MIVHSSPEPRKFVRAFFVGVAILGALSLLFTGVVDFAGLPEAWKDPERDALYLVIMKVAIGLLGMVGATWQLTQQLTIGDPLQRLVATEETLAIKTVRKPATFLKRRDCIALAAQGKALVMADGTTHIIHAYGAKLDSVETFIDSLYAQWWPGLTRAEVRDYLNASTPPRSKWNLLPLFLMPSTFLFIPTFSMWDSAWIPITLFVIAFLCLMSMTFRLVRRELQEANSIRYPLVEPCEAGQNADWNRAYDPLD